MPTSRDRLPAGVEVDTSLSDPKARAQKYLDIFNDGNITENSDGKSPLEFPRLDEVTMHRDVLKLVDATAKPKCTATFELHVKPALCSRTGNLHGGVAAIIFDMCSSIALAPIAKEGFWAFSGVSRNLVLNFFRPVPINSTLLVECEVVQVGKTVATISGVFKRKEDGVVLIGGRHDKVSVDIAARTNL